LTPPTVAVLGAGGTMGGGIARNLAGAGIEVRAWNRTAAKIEDLTTLDGVTACATTAEAAAGAGFVLTMLSDDEATIAALEGSDGAAAGSDDGAIWIQMGTIGIAGTERCAELARHAGLVFFDAPVLGTKQPAQAGELVVLASGPDERRERLEPIFDAVGKRTIWVGEAGAGSKLKIVVNSWIVSVVEGTAEMIALAEAIGIAPSLALDAIAGGPLDLPYMQAKGRAMIEREFPPSFRLSLAAKDAALAVRAAAFADLELPMLEAISRRFAEAAREHGDEDLAAVYLASAPAPETR
jgi:3-hydroxyisobutyrate dehydrogenase